MAENVDADRISQNVVFVQRDLRGIYHELFDEAVEEYNAKQKRKDRIIQDYYNKIKDGHQEHLFTEVIVQIGNMKDSNCMMEETAVVRQILEEYMRGFEERNPSLRVFNAVLHMDEQTPHLHIDFVPFSKGNKRGISTKVSLKGAMKALGFAGTGRNDTESMQWVRNEKENLATLMQQRGFMYKCSKRRKLTALCENKSSYEYNEVMDSVFSVIRQHMKLCIEKTKFVQKMNNRKENILQYDIYTKQIAKLQNDVRRITANKSGLYEDYREQLITAEELCQYQKEYESRVNEIEAQITELLYRRSLYEKDFHIDEGWEETVNKYLSKRKLTRELVEAFVSEIVFTDNNIEVKLLYDDFLKELLEVAEEREVGSNG